MQIDNLETILARRKEIEGEIVGMLKETKSDFTLDHVRDAIYNEEDNDDMMKVVAMFDRGGDASELSNVLELTNDAWNYFPHEILGGISPAEKLLEYNQQIVRTTQKENKELYQCEKCGFHYADKEWAEKCEAWCKEHHSCNLEITAHAEK